ncbi:efflux RND transporter periplasmic adaptor subunit [Aminipila terrae]|uniref:Efflux RND transporter periplasmic adaptor subunit n=1 Tax=Aminipila terrae TaxID=2697030 RepID=A0A6P1MK22_9FIRM|nr:efflux RND transporter periplasmic adaptor subunit [Aminipila terrae]QHI73004.1 efflux RND transporter periplasmic adaptor subunit [Aminipila terrae]
MLNLKKVKKKKVIKIGIVLIIIAVVIVALMPKDGQKDQQLPVASFSLEKKDVIESISTSGKVESVESKNVSAAADGKIKNVYVKLGQQIKKGDLLAQLDTTSIQREMDKAQKSSKTEMNSAFQDMNSKYREYDNAKFLYDMGEISKDDLLKAQNAYEAASSDYEIKKQSADTTSLQQQIADATLKSPISGTVTLVNATEGNSSSGVLFTIENTQDLQVAANVSEYDINQVKKGQKVIVKTEMTGDTELSGEVLSIAPTAQKEETTGKTTSSGKVQFLVEISIKDKNPGVKIGTNARVNIVTAGKEGFWQYLLMRLLKASRAVVSMWRKNREAVI